VGDRARGHNLVGSNVCEAVTDPNRDVLLKTWGPQCKQCKEFTPVWEALGELLKDVPGVMIAQIDMDRNRVECKGAAEGLTKGSQPAMRFAAAGQDGFVKVRRRVRKIEDFVKFLAENCRSEGCRAAIEGASASKDEL